MTNPTDFTRERDEAAKAFVEKHVFIYGEDNFIGGVNWALTSSLVREMAEALTKISKNKTEDRELYTMGCDCDEEAIKALERYNAVVKGLK